MNLSRRDWLQLMGITLASGLVADLPTILPMPDAPQAVLGRTIGRVFVHDGIGGVALHELWSDHIIPLYAQQDSHYLTDGGYVESRFVEPIRPYTLPEIHRRGFPFMAEVIAPAASFHQAASVHAAKVKYRGVRNHASTLTAISVLQDSATATYWYEMVDEHGQSFGWSQALHWAKLPPIQPYPLSLRLDQRAQRLTCFIDQTEWFSSQSPVTHPLLPAEYHLPRPKPGHNYYRWLICTGSSAVGLLIVPTLAARAIYLHSPSEIPLEVV
ncbi:MAG: hypothetical protein ACOYL5_10435 [Phototrophicaceae bacterium]|jgi:hypothetical protein